MRQIKTSKFQIGDSVTFSGSGVIIATHEYSSGICVRIDTDDLVEDVHIKEDKVFRCVQPEDVEPIKNGKTA